MVVAIKVCWTGFALTLVSVYVPPLTFPHRSCIVEAGLVPTEAVFLTELGTVLDLLDPQRELVLIMGDLNARIVAFAPTVEGQVPRMSINTVLNAHGPALFSLLTQQELLLLSDTT